MKKNNLLTTFKKNKNIILFLLSTASFLCLFLSPSLISLLIIILIFIGVSFLTFFGKIKRPVFSCRLFCVCTVLLSLFILYIGYDSFKSSWILSSKLAKLSNLLHLTSLSLLSIIGIFGCVIGFYAVYVLLYWIIYYFKDNFLVDKKTDVLLNLKRNWYFPISAVAFFYLNAIKIPGYFLGLIIAVIISLMISSQFSSLIGFIKQNNKLIQVISFLTSLGICFCCGQTFLSAEFPFFVKLYIIEEFLPFSVDLLRVISFFLSFVSFFFVYVWVNIFWKKMIKIISDNKLFDDINFSELIVYIIIIISLVSLVILTFSQTDAFYGTDYHSEIIYTSDSPTLVKGDAYLVLTYSENDIRQPLFAVFSAPFIGIPYLFGKLFGVSSSVQAMLINFVQVFLLFVANFILAKIMHLNRLKRVCFLLLTSCTYTTLLFTLMMEQYIISYFWLIFCVYFIVENKRPDRILLWASGGTLVTSMVLLPFMSDNNSIRKIRYWFNDMFKLGLEFILFIFAFCRFDVIFNISSRVSFLADFTGKNLSFSNKLYQYISFISNCFVAPDAGVNSTLYDHISWQLNKINNINVLGIVILLLVFISIIINKNKRSSLISMGWIVFSIVILLGFGWGTKENGLILYALYFGWAFLVLLFQLVEKVEDVLRVKFIVPFFSVSCAFILLIVNLDSIMEMLRFAIKYFPV